MGVTRQRIWQIEKTKAGLCRACGVGARHRCERCSDCYSKHLERKRIGTGIVPDPAETGRKLRRLRERRKLSLRTVAARMGISAPSLSNLERGRSTFSQKRQEQFRAALKGAACQP